MASLLTPARIATVAAWLAVKCRCTLLSPLVVTEHHVVDREVGVIGGRYHRICAHIVGVDDTLSGTWITTTFSQQGSLRGAVETWVRLKHSIIRSVRG